MTFCCGSQRPTAARRPLVCTCCRKSGFATRGTGSRRRKKPSLTVVGNSAISVEHEALGSFTVHYEKPQDLLFCDNETNAPKLFGATDAHGYFKDAFHEYIVHGNTGAVNPARTGTKAAGVYAPTYRREGA